MQNYSPGKGYVEIPNVSKYYRKKCSSSIFHTASDPQPQ